MQMSHSFEEKTFTHLTYCDHCKQLLWGVIKQGLQCKGCGYTCHRKCIDLAPKCSSAKPTRFLDDIKHNRQKINKSSRAETYLRQLKQRSQNASIASTSSIKSKVASGSSNKKQQEQKSSTLHHLYDIITSDKFQTLVADAATNQDEPVCAYLDNQAALNPQITAKNFTRFVSRCGPVFAFRDELLLLLNWNNRVDSTISLLVYCLICVYPKLVFFIPQITLVYLMASTRHNTQNFTKMEKDDKKKTTAASTIVESEKKKSPVIGKSNSTTTKSATTIETPSLFNLSTALLGSDQSPEYMRNLQNIQNMMGEFSDAYDWMVMQYSKHLSSGDETNYIILQAIIISTAILFLIIYFVPVNMIFLCFGLTLFSINTRFAKYMMRELKPYLFQWSKTQAEEIKQKYMDLENSLTAQQSIKEISVYENQRWWSMSGYLHEMMEGERLPWSNYSGTVYFPIITEIPAPKGYRWRETSEWKLDTKGPWINDYLGYEIIATPTKDGWVYSDNDWNIKGINVEPEEDFERDQRKEAITRRRRWIRECEVVS